MECTIFTSAQDWKVELVIAFFGMLYALRQRVGRRIVFGGLLQSGRNLRCSRFFLHAFYFRGVYIGGLFISLEEYIES
jgi:hypothetical protein